MQTLFTTPSRSQKGKGRPTAHQPPGSALMSAVLQEYIGGHARTEAERLAALARIRAKTAADFARQDRETKDARAGTKKSETRMGVDWLRDHDPNPTYKGLVDGDDDETESESVDIDTIDVDTDGSESGDGRTTPVDIDADTDGDGDGDEDEGGEVDDLIARRESRARADRWGRPALGFENGAPAGMGTGDICSRGQGRAFGVRERARADEARAFQEIREVYPVDGVDYKVLCLLCDPLTTKKEIADSLGRDPRSIRYAAARIKKQAATGNFHTQTGAGASGVDMDDRTGVVDWLTQPLPKAACGRKKRGVTSPALQRVRIRIPKRLRLAPREPQNVAVRAWGTKPRKPRVRRPRVPDFASPQADFGAMFGEGWGIPPCAADPSAMGGAHGLM